MKYKTVSELNNDCQIIFDIELFLFINLIKNHRVTIISHQDCLWLVGLLIRRLRYFSIPLPLGSANGDPITSS